MSGTNTVSPLRQRMIEDMAARKLDPHTQRSHIYSCKRFTTWLKRSPDTATADEVRLFQLRLVEDGASICNRNRIMTGVRFLFRVTLRRHDLAAEIWHMKEPQKLPPVLSPEEIKRILNMATSLKARAMLSLAYGCGLRASEVARLRVCDIDSEQMIIRVVQSKGRKDRHVMLPAEILDLLRQWWKVRPTRSGGRGHPPRARSRLARGRPRPCEPRPIEGDECNRALPEKPVERPVVFFWLHAPAAERPRKWTNDQESSSLTASTSNITV